MLSYIMDLQGPRMICELHSMGKNSLKISEPQPWTVAFPTTEALTLNIWSLEVGHASRSG